MTLFPLLKLSMQLAHPRNFRIQKIVLAEDHTGCVCVYIFALGSKFPTIPYFSMIQSLLWNTVTANLAFEIVGRRLHTR